MKDPTKVDKWGKVSVIFLLLIALGVGDKFHFAAQRRLMEIAGTAARANQTDQLLMSSRDFTTEMTPFFGICTRRQVQLQPG